MTDLDDHLRGVARRWVDVETEANRSRIDLNAALAQVTSPIVVPERSSEPGHQGRRWAVAASVVALVAGGVALVATLGGGGDLRTSDSTIGTSSPGPAPTTEAVVPPTSLSTVTSAPTTAPVVGTGAALGTIEPDVVFAGASVVVRLTPSSSVARACTDTLVVFGTETDAPLGAIGSGGAFGPYSSTLDRSCSRQPSADPVEALMPTTIAPGEYRMCIAPPETAAGCAELSVVAPPAGAGRAPVPYVVGQSLATADPVSGLHIELRDIAPDGTDLGRSPVDVADLAGFPVDVGDGIAIGYSDNDVAGPIDGRCRVRPIRARGAAGGSRPVPVIDGGTEMVGNANRIVVARDVCPDGTRWGDPGTYFELVAYDPSDAAPEPTLLTRIDPDPSKVIFDGGTVIYSTDQLTPGSISASGTFVGVSEPLNSEQGRWHVYRTDAAGGPLELGSACTAPGDIVGRPAFPSDDVVVVARECDAPDAGLGRLVVEAVSLSDLQPVWSHDVAGVQISSYTRTVTDVSAVSVEGELWVIVSSSGGVEQPTRAVLLHDDEESDITRGDGFDVYRYAFTARELIGPRDIVF